MATWNNALAFTAPKERLTLSKLNEGKRAAIELHSDYYLRGAFSGLRLRSRQNAALGDIHLLSAEQIVMNDGAVVTGWQNLIGATNYVGVGGLDSGTVAVSKWYEIYAISKSSDGSKHVLLHRAREYNKDEAQDVDDTFVEVNGGTTPTSKQMVAQGFQTDLTGVCPFIEVKLQKLGTWAGQLWFTLEADNAGNPSGTPLATSDPILGTYFATSAAVYRFYFRAPVSLTTGVQYHLVAHVSVAGNATDYISWRATTTVPYTRGTTKLWNGSAWSASALDQCFHIFVTIDPALVLPAGYDRYCRIGFAYYNSGNLFTPFLQIDRRVQTPEVPQGTGTNTVPVLASWDTIIPPVTVMARFAVANSVADTYVALAPSAEPVNTTLVGTVIGVPNLANAGIPGPTLEIYCEGQANYVFTAAGTYQVYSCGYQW